MSSSRESRTTQWSSRLRCGGVLPDRPAKTLSGSTLHPLYSRPYTPRWLAQLAKSLGETSMRYIMTAELL
jgi:hypothetical protein